MALTSRKESISQAILILFASTVFLASCVKGKDEATLQDEVRQLAASLRSDQFSYETVLTYLLKIEENLVHSENRELAYGDWRTSISHKWNSDSSIILINVQKTLPVGFRREKIIRAGDSVLFVYRFSTEPLGPVKRDDYTFLESIYYFHDTTTIKHMDRVEHRRRNLRDTIAFRKKRFNDYSDSGFSDYFFELEHIRALLE